MQFRELRERFQKGFRIPHLINPSPKETVEFLGRTKYESLRVTKYKGDIYVWDGNLAVHHDFKKNELMLQFSEYASTDKYDSNLNPIESDEATKIGKHLSRDNEEWVRDVMKAIEYRNVGKFVRDSRYKTNSYYDHYKFEVDE